MFVLAYPSDSKRECMNKMQAKGKCRVQTCSHRITRPVSIPPPPLVCPSPSPRKCSVMHRRGIPPRKIKQIRRKTKSFVILLFHFALLPPPPLAPDAARGVNYDGVISREASWKRLKILSLAIFFPKREDLLGEGGVERGERGRDGEWERRRNIQRDRLVGRQRPTDRGRLTDGKRQG